MNLVGHPYNLVQILSGHFRHLKASGQLLFGSPQAHSIHDGFWWVLQQLALNAGCGRLYVWNLPFACA